jgi:hypothetical protein
VQISGAPAIDQTSDRHGVGSQCGQCRAEWLNCGCWARAGCGSDR